MDSVTNRFPALVAEVLEDAGWREGRRDDARAQSWALAVATYVAPDGRQHRMVAPAVQAYAEFGGLRVTPGGAGQDVARSAFTVDPRRVLPTVRTLAALADALGTPLSPLGDEGDGVGILAVDGAGRVFLLDHAGEWHLGSTVDEALCTLVLGRQPARLAQDGSWR